MQGIQWRLQGPEPCWLWQQLWGFAAYRDKGGSMFVFLFRRLCCQGFSSLPLTFLQFGQAFWCLYVGKDRCLESSQIKLYVDFSLMTYQTTPKNQLRPCRIETCFVIPLTSASCWQLQTGKSRYFHVLRLVGLSGLTVASIVSLVLLFFPPWLEPWCSMNPKITQARQVRCWASHLPNGQEKRKVKTACKLAT